MSIMIIAGILLDSIAIFKTIYSFFNFIYMNCDHYNMVQVVGEELFGSFMIINYYVYQILINY